MKEIVECSSIYSIDLASILFSSIMYPDRRISVYINDEANISTEYRTYLHKLALPMFSWTVDPKGQIRQIHIPIENLNGCNFLNACIQAIDSYLKVLGKSDFRDEIHLRRLIKKIEGEFFTDSIEYYVELIRQILCILGVNNFSVKKYSDIKKNIIINNFDNFLFSISSQIKKLPDGNYKFHKGGSIEMRMEQDVFTIKRMSNYEGDINFIDSKNNRFSKNDLNKNEIFFKGPLETYLLAEEGMLLHLPWYGQASYSNEINENTKGIEYISPVTVSSLKRVSPAFSGRGNRLSPSGYSLIEYEHENVLKILQNVYPENKSIKFSDLDDWKYMINNYPACLQKAAKSQNRTGEFVRGHFIDEYKKILNNSFFEEFRRKNYLNLGINAIVMSCGLRILREYFQKKSPYYLNQQHLMKFMNMDKYEGKIIVNLCDDLFKNLTIFIEYFYADKKLNLNKLKDKFYVLTRQLSEEECFDNIVKLLSGLEQIIIKLTGFYYEIALFISCVMLKANIFSIFVVLGYEYEECIKKILQQREEKILYFSPEYFNDIT